jgi:hypothetical protein
MLHAPSLASPLPYPVFLCLLNTRVPSLVCEQPSPQKRTAFKLGRLIASQPSMDNILVVDFVARVLLLQQRALVYYLWPRFHHVARTVLPQMHFQLTFAHQRSLSLAVVSGSTKPEPRMAHLRSILHETALKLLVAVFMHRRTILYYPLQRNSFIACIYIQWFASLASCLIMDAPCCLAGAGLMPAV